MKDHKLLHVLRGELFQKSKRGFRIHSIELVNKETNIKVVMTEKIGVRHYFPGGGGGVRRSSLSGGTFGVQGYRQLLKK